MRVMKMVRRLGSLSMELVECMPEGSPKGMLAGVKDFARLLFLRRPSARPIELVASMLEARTEASAGLVSRGTM